MLALLDNSLSSVTALFILLIIIFTVVSSHYAPKIPVTFYTIPHNILKIQFPFFSLTHIHYAVFCTLPYFLWLNFFKKCLLAFFWYKSSRSFLLMIIRWFISSYKCLFIIKYLSTVTLRVPAIKHQTIVFIRVMWFQFKVCS